jgi:hypothetical protein
MKAYLAHFGLSDSATLRYFINLRGQFCAVAFAVRC